MTTTQSETIVADENYIDAAIAENAATFDALVRVVRSRSNDPGSDEQTLRLAQAAAEFAWYNPMGRYAAPELEEILHSVGTRLENFGGPVREYSQGPLRSVLHVFSEAQHSAGGHVRFPWRWIGQDPGHRHSVAVTSQPGFEGPSPTLKALARDTGGFVEVLNAQFPEYLDRARRLRQLAAGFDLVVLHIHPYDVIASVALSGREQGPPVVFVNHADHVFWLGTGISDIVANFRKGGAELSIARRGIAPERSTILPLVVDAIERYNSRIEAKAALGIESDRLVLLTAAHGYKYTQIDRWHFLDLVVPVLERFPKATLVAAGGGKDGSWTKLAEQMGPQVRLLERQSDMTLLNEAADVYLDPYPFTSCTSFLEAARYGTPIVNFAPYGPEVSTIASDDFAEDGVILRTSSPEEHASVLGRLLESEPFRLEVGERAKHAVEASNLTEGWRKQLAALYDRVPTIEPVRAVPPLPAQNAGTLDRLVYALNSSSGQALPLTYSLPHMGVEETTLAESPALFSSVLDKPALSVILATAGDSAATLATLESIAQSCAGVGDLDVIAIDNGSTDATGSLLQQLSGDLTLHRNPSPLPWSAAWAQGVEQSKGFFVLFISPGVILDDNWWEPMFRRLARDLSCSAVTPTIIDGNRTTVTNTPDAGYGVCMLVRKTALDAGTLDSVRHVLDARATLLPK